MFYKRETFWHILHSMPLPHCSCQYVYFVYMPAFISWLYCWHVSQACIWPISCGGEVSCSFQAVFQSFTLYVIIPWWEAAVKEHAFTWTDRYTYSSRLSRDCMGTLLDSHTGCLCSVWWLYCSVAHVSHVYKEFHFDNYQYNDVIFLDHRWKSEKVGGGAKNKSKKK